MNEWRGGSSPAQSLLPIRTATAILLLLAGAVASATALALAGRLAPTSPVSPARSGASSSGVAPVASSPARPGSPVAAGSAGLSSEGYAAIVKQVMPAVVNISSLQVIQTYEQSPFLADPFFRQFFGEGFQDFAVPRERRALSLGSGVVVDDQGTILTNFHVVQNARDVKAALADGRELRARIVGVDSRTDLAVLRVDHADLPKVAMANSELLEVGDIVLAIGNPFGIGQTVTLGIVSALGRGSLGLADYEDFIQTDAAINPGNSGGALINARGELVGINTAIYSRSGGYQGIGFAIPSNMARDVLDSILKTGRVVRGYVGIDLQPITEEIAHAFHLSDTRGALVASIDPNGPAAEVGLRRGDVILELHGRSISSDDELRTQLSRLRPGDKVTLQITREGRRREVELVLGEPPAEARQRARRRG
jgi:Do/DeqQ family serine protease